MVVGGCVIEGGMHRIRRDTVNERAVRILLECILVLLMFFFSHVFFLFSAFVRLEWGSQMRVDNMQDIYNLSESHVNPRSLICVNTHRYHVGRRPL